MGDILKITQDIIDDSEIDHAIVYFYEKKNLLEIKVPLIPTNKNHHIINSILEGKEDSHEIIVRDLKENDPLIKRIYKMTEYQLTKVWHYHSSDNEDSLIFHLEIN